MNNPSIRIDGAILSPELLEDLHDDTFGQRPADFGLDSGIKVKDEIVHAWAAVQDDWRKSRENSTHYKPVVPLTEPLKLKMVPLLGLLGD